MKSKPKIQIVFFLCLGILFLWLSPWLISNAFTPDSTFDGQRAYQDVLTQVSFGPRTPGSVAHARTIAYIQQELEKAGWKVQIQATEWQGFSVKNILASRSGITPTIVVGAHYDSRLLADQDTSSRSSEPVPGANDGASGVAVLLELARTLPTKSIPVMLVFFFSF